MNNELELWSQSPVQTELWDTKIAETHRCLDLEDEFEQRQIELDIERLKNALTIGENLQFFKNNLPHGEYMDFVKKEFGLRRQTSQNYSNLYLNQSKLPTVGNLDMKSRYELTTHNTPPVVIEMVESGEIPPTLEAIREAKRATKVEEEARKQAEREKESAQQQALFHEKAARLAESERDGLRYQLEHLPTPEPQTIRVEVEKEVLPPDIQEQITALQAQIATEKANIAEKEAKITTLTGEKDQLNEKVNKNSIESQVMQKRLRVHQNWGRINDEVYANVSSYLRQVPDFFDPDVFEEKQYAYLAQTIDLFKHAISSLEKKVH